MTKEESAAINKKWENILVGDEFSGDDLTDLLDEITVKPKVHNTDSYVTITDLDLNLVSDDDEWAEEVLENESFGNYGYNFDQYLEQFPVSSSSLFKALLKITLS